MKRIRSSAVLVAAFAATLLAGLGAARAENKAWTAAKGVVPADVSFVGGINIATIQKSSMYQMVVPALIAKDPDVKEGFTKVKTGCGIDVQTAVTDVAFAVTDNEDALIVLALKDIDDAKALSCLKKMAESEKKGTVTAKTSGKITEYVMDDGKGKKESMYVAWLGKGVLAISSKPEDKSLLEKMIGGKGLKSGDVASWIGKAKSDAAFWIVGAKKTPVGKSGTAKGGYGAVDLSGGVVSIDGNIVMSSADEAKKMVAEANADLAKQSGNVPPDLQKIMKSIKITQQGDMVNLKASATEKEIMSLIGMLMTQM